MRRKLILYQRNLQEQLRAVSDGKQVARGINSIQAMKEAGGWRVTGIMVQAEWASAPLPKKYQR